ncbi:transcription factor WhiB [Micromonospora siamensis]|uniref:Transcriptional regulator WhiB n=2 Tax=Micromonospora siamensis TaxID=299152 RepID=A0A1C5GQG8_9ACTN|nr:transcription factor WhiB [Micromonospora siamensis]
MARQSQTSSVPPWGGRPDDRGEIDGWSHEVGRYCKGGRVQMGMITDWPSLAACQNGDPDALFVQGAEQNVAKRICRSCPVRYECLADALDNRIEFGVWGGMTERERRALLRRHPQVTSWRKMFEAAMRKNGKEKSGGKDKVLVPTG